MSLLPQCPNCREPVPFARTQWARGKAFACRWCGRSIVLPRNASPFVVLLALSFGFDRIDSFGSKVVFGVAMLTVSLLVDWLLTQPRLEVADEP